MRSSKGLRLFLEIRQEVATVSIRKAEKLRYRVSTRLYIYSLWSAKDACLIGWHYHPELNENPVLYPHIKIFDKPTEEQRAQGFQPHKLHNLHIPSGRVSLEEVVTFLISEMNVLPARTDWQRVLKETGERFERNKSWGRKPVIAE